MKITLNESETPAAAQKEADRTAEPARNLTDEELKKLRRTRFEQMGLREKILYFLDYYKIPLILITATVLLIASIAHEVLTAKPTGFTAELINAQLYDTQEFGERFAEAAGIDTSKELCVIDADALSSGGGTGTQADLYSAERILVRISAAEMDILAADEEIFRNYARQSIFSDLREALDAETYALFEPWLVYEPLELEDGQLSEPVPTGIRLDTAPVFCDAGIYPNGGVIGIVANSPHPDRAVAFLKFIFAFQQK